MHYYIQNAMVSMSRNDKVYFINGKRAKIRNLHSSIISFKYAIVVEKKPMAIELIMVEMKIALEMNINRTKKVTDNQCCERGTVKQLRTIAQYVRFYVYMESELNMVNSLTSEISRRSKGSS